MSGLMKLCAENTAELDWGIIGSTVITGIAVVFLILAILVGFLWLMGKILGERKKKPQQTAVSQAVPPAAPAPAPAPAVYDGEDEDDEEIIAVIAAAIAAYGEAEGRQYRVTRVRKAGNQVRSGWSAAGIAENTRPF